MQQIGLEKTVDNIFERGLDCLNDTSMASHLEKAIELFTNAAKQGHSGAAYYLGYIFSGQNEFPDYNVSEEYQKYLDHCKAATWYKKSAELGDAEGQYRYALSCLYGNGTVKDDQEAAHWAQKSAGQNFPDGIILLAFMYRDGKGLPCDRAKAIELLEKAATQPITEPKVAACIGLAEIYFIDGEQDRTLGFDSADKNYLLAAKWASEAVKYEIDSEAYYYLGTIYLNGYGVKQDIEKAKHFIELGVKYKNPASYYLMARLYLAEDNSKSAMPFLQEAVKHKSFPEHWKACILLGELYLKKENLYLALLCFHRAQSQEFGLTEYLIADIFEKSGEPMTALHWKFLSANKGFIPAGDKIVKALQEKQMTIWEWRETSNFANNYASDDISQQLKEYVNNLMMEELKSSAVIETH